MGIEIWKYFNNEIGFKGWGRGMGFGSRVGFNLGSGF